MFLDEGLVELEDDGNRKQNTSTSTDSTHEISNDREGSDTHTTERSSSRNVSVEDVDQGRVTVTLHDHLVVTQLLGNITSRSSRNFNPSLGEESTGSQDESQVKDGVERIVDNFGKRRRRRDIVGNSSNGDLLTRGTFHFLPLSEQTNQNVGRSSVVQELRDKVQVGNQSGLENDGHVGGVEQLDGVVSLLSSVLLVLDRKVNTPSLEVDNDNKNQDSRQKVGQVGKVLAVKGFLQSADLVGSGDEKMEQSNDGSLEFSTTTSVQSGRTESLPNDGFANVGSDKERDTRSETVSLLEELVKGKDNETGAKELSNDENSVTSSDGSEISVHSTDNVSDGFTSSDQNTEKLLSAREESSIFLDIVIDFDDTGTSEKLHNKTGCNNRTDSKLHKSPSVGSEDNTHPVERIGRLGGLNSINGDLTAHQKDEQSDGGPKELFTEGDLQRYRR